MPTMVMLMDLKKGDLERIQQAAPEWTIVHGKDRTNWEVSLAKAEIVAGWNKEAEAELLQADSKLQWVQSWSAGINRMPLDAFRDKAVCLTSASGVHPNPISETIFAMMLAWTRKLPVYFRQQAEKRWEHGGLRLELHGKTILIAGVGAIGQETARIAKAFGMRVIGIRRNGQALPEIDTMATPHELLSFLPEADYIVNTLPLTPQTHHFFGKDAFGAMKSSAFFVNIGRGATVDTAALVEVLQQGNLGGAGLDVFEQEPLPADHPLWDMEQVILTPHTAGSTEHYHVRAMDIFLRNLALYTQGERPLINEVDFTLSY